MAEPQMISEACAHDPWRVFIGLRATRCQIITNDRPISAYDNVLQPSRRWFHNLLHTYLHQNHAERTARYHFTGPVDAKPSGGFGSKFRPVADDRGMALSVEVTFDQTRESIQAQRRWTALRFPQTLDDTTAERCCPCRTCRPKLQKQHQGNYLMDCI